MKILDVVNSSSDISNLYTKIYRGGGLAIVSLLFIVFKTESLLSLGAIAIYFLATAYIIYNAQALLRLLSGKISSLALGLGLFLMLGATALDVGVTIMESPDLQREANPIVLRLFELDWPLAYVYAAFFLQNIMNIVLFTFLWICFLKVYNGLLSSIPYKNLRTTYRWLSGGGNISLLDWCIGRNIDPYYAVPFMGFIFIIGSSYRIYAAFEWFRVIP